MYVCVSVCVRVRVCMCARKCVCLRIKCVLKDDFMIRIFTHLFI